MTAAEKLWAVGRTGAAFSLWDGRCLAQLRKRLPKSPTGSVCPGDPGLGGQTLPGRPLSRLARAARLHEAPTRGLTLARFRSRFVTQCCREAKGSV